MNQLTRQLIDANQGLTNLQTWAVVLNRRVAELEDEPSLDAAKAEHLAEVRDLLADADVRLSCGQATR